MFLPCVILMSNTGRINIWYHFECILRNRIMSKALLAFLLQLSYKQHSWCRKTKSQPHQLNANSWIALSKESYGIPLNPISTTHCQHRSKGLQWRSQTTFTLAPSYAFRRALPISHCDFCRQSICNTSYFMELSGWWSIPSHQPLTMTSLLLPYTSLTD